MSPTAPKKESLDFHSDYYFNTKSPVAFTSPLALYRDAKKRYPSLTFVKLRLGYSPKTPTPFINQLGIIFREIVIVTGIDDQRQAGLVDMTSLAHFNKEYKFLLACIDVFSKFSWVVPLKNKTGESLVNGFQRVLDTSRSPKATDWQRN